MTDANKYGNMPNIDDLYKDEPYIHTQAGRFYLDRPQFVPAAIGHSLGQLARFNGHTSRFYSVAEHCMLVAYILEREYGGNGLEGLWHDALEAYLTDIPSPWKHLFPDVKRFDDALEAKLRAFLGLAGEHKSTECKKADILALFIEAYFLLPERGEDFHDPWNLRKEALAMVATGEYNVRCLDWKTAGSLWVSFHEAYNGTKGWEEIYEEIQEYNDPWDAFRVQAPGYALDSAGRC
jgi:hypothetical protein